MKRGLAGLGAGVALVFAGLWVLHPGSGAPEARDDPGPAAERSEATGSAGPVRQDRAMPPLPASLAGTREDGALVVVAGRFVPTADALDLFDYYLAATGEEPDARIRERIVAAIHARLEGEDAAAAEALLDDYLAYRRRASALLTGELVGEDLERRLQYVRELRRDVFGAEIAAALFGEEEARWFTDLERLQIATDPSLEADEQEQRLAALDATLPEAVRKTREAARAHTLLRRDEARLQAAGAGAVEIAQLRRERFGPLAANRLEALDAARARWQARVDAYRAELDRLLQDAPRGAREGLVDEVRSRHFEPHELVRVRALDAARASRRM